MKHEQLRAVAEDSALNRRKTIEFNLLGNAQDSLRQAVQLLAFQDVGSRHAQLKHAIVNTAHCIELLLKERLRRVHPAFIWEKVENYARLDAKTVTVDAVITRLKRIGNVSITEADESVLKSIRTTRNAIEHYEWFTTEKEAKLIIGNALSFVFAFGKIELGIDLASDFQKDDTWRTLLDELMEFVRSHSARLQEVIRASGDEPVECQECGEVTVSWQSGSCELCGHWQDFQCPS